MSKYDSLWRYFDNKVENEIDLSFGDIKKILGFEIDHSFLNFKKELEKYNYRVKKIHLKEKFIEFERII